MVKEFYIGVYPGRYNEKGSVAIIEKMSREGTDKPAYSISLVQELNQSVGSDINFIARSVNEQVRMLKRDANNSVMVIVDQTHQGEPVMDAFKDLGVDVKGIILSNNEIIKEEKGVGVFIVPKRDVLSSLYLLKDDYRIGFKGDMFSLNNELNAKLHNGIKDFVIRNIDSPLSNVFKSDDKNGYDNIYFASAITAWYADYIERHKT